MLFRELAGAGYWGSGLLLILCALAIGKRRPTLLIMLIAVPIALAIAADAAFGYFVATRQIIWVLPSVAVLAAQAIERKPGIAIPVAALLAAVCVWQSYRHFTAPGENWEEAANKLAGEIGSGACVEVVPPDQHFDYEFFRPALANAPCPALRTAVAFTPYATKAQRDAAISALRSEGYIRQYGYVAGKSEIVLFGR
jgi:hypothetical protein